jgi:hypothetical protein
MMGVPISMLLSGEVRHRIALTGQGIASIDDDFSERDAKNVVQLPKRGLKWFEERGRGDR